MTELDRFTNWFSEKPRNTAGTRILQICIGVMICFRIGTELPFASFLWGPNGVSSDNSAKDMFGENLGGYIDSTVYSSMSGIYFIIVVLFIGATGLIFNYKTRISTLLCFMTFLLLEIRSPGLNDGGDNITRLSLFYMILLCPNPMKSKMSNLKVWLHNVGIAAITAQLMIMYWTSGFMKITGEKWQNGTAMYVISNVEWFSLPAIRDIFLNPVVTTIGTYAPMVFMILFPIAIFSRLKFLWIFVGIFLHLGIAYTMGLLTFSLVMIGLELFIITDEEYIFFKDKLQNLNTIFSPKKIYRKLSTGLGKIRT
jgi:hypothetical protein